MKTYESFTECFYDLIDRVYTSPEYVSSPRGMLVKESLGVSFRITNPRNRLLYVPERNTSLGYTIAEAVWYFIGDNKTDWISNYSSFWSDISDDGVTANSAYGARIFKPHPRTSMYDTLKVGDNSQWQFVLNELSRDPDSRRAVVHVKSPRDNLDKKDVPCTLTLQFFIRENKLHMIVNMRSSDLIFGLTYDVPAFTLFQEKLAQELDVGLGSYTHMSNSLHVYKRHFSMCNKILNGKSNNKSVWDPMPKMPKCVFSRFEHLDVFQEALRNTSDVNKIKALVTTYSPDGYWKDWALILASHRAAKLGYKDLCKSLVRSTSFNGYHVFKR
jgi:thymidylate synthase